MRRGGPQFGQTRFSPEKYACRVRRRASVPDGGDPRIGDVEVRPGVSVPVSISTV
jgi:hypothetical protein